MWIFWKDDVYGNRVDKSHQNQHEKKNQMTFPPQNAHFLCDDISTEKVYSLVKACTLLIVHMYTLGDRSCASMAKSFILIGKPCTLAATRFTNSLMTDDNLTRRIKSYWNLFILYEKKFAQKWPCILTFCFIPTGPKLKVCFNFYIFQKQFFSVSCHGRIISAYLSYSYSIITGSRWEVDAFNLT